MRITGLDHIVITTANIDKCIAFYAGVLGLRHELKNGKHAFYFGVQKINADRQNFCRQRSILHTAVRISACLLTGISAQLKQK
mgnify:CR=1 FL=1